jgi:hypothetical protein
VIGGGSAATVEGIMAARQAHATRRTAQNDAFMIREGNQINMEAVSLNRTPSVAARTSAAEASEQAMIRARVHANVAESRVARQSSNFGKQSETRSWQVGRHGDMPTPRPVGFESHHGVNSVWSEVNIPGYRAVDAPAVLMKNVPFHNATRGTFNRFRTEIAARQGVSPRDVDWSKVPPGTAWRLAEEQFGAARVPESFREEYFRQFNQYLKTLGR